MSLFNLDDVRRRLTEEDIQRLKNIRKYLDQTFIPQGKTTTLRHGEDYSHKYGDRMYKILNDIDAITLDPNFRMNIPRNFASFKYMAKILKLARKCCDYIDELLSPNGSKVKSDITEESKKKVPGSAGFPTPQGAKWGDVAMIVYIDSNKLRISIGEITRIFTLYGLGMRTKRSKKPKLQWYTLVKLSHEHYITWDSGEKHDSVKKRIQELRKTLKRLLGIDEDPFVIRDEGGYKPKFSITLHAAEKINRKKKERELEKSSVENDSEGNGFSIDKVEDIFEEEQIKGKYGQRFEAGDNRFPRGGEGED